MATTYSEALTEIESRINTNWSSTEVAYENVEALDYTDANRPPLSDGSASYIGVRILFPDSYAAEVGPNAIKRTWGYIDTTFYTRQSEGAKPNQTLIDSMCDLFEYQTISGIVFKELIQLTPYTAEGWYVTPTMLRFYFNR